MRQQDAKLVAAKASGEIGVSNRSAERLTHGSQNFISGQVIEAVVHLLEIVEIDVGQRRRKPQPGGAVALSGEGFVETAPVDQPRQIIQTRVFVLPQVELFYFRDEKDKEEVQSKAERGVPIGNDRHGIPGRLQVVQIQPGQ